VSFFTCQTRRSSFADFRENDLLFFARNADAGIAYREKKIEGVSTGECCVACLAYSGMTSQYGTRVYFDGDFAPFGKLDRIAEKVLQQLPQQRPITADSRRHFLLMVTRICKPFSSARRTKGVTLLLMKARKLKGAVSSLILPDSECRHTSDSV
jgi:hypothetical protein